ncbi:glucosaminidase domain-containing protein [Vibrio navarrensis]
MPNNTSPSIFLKATAIAMAVAFSSIGPYLFYEEQRRELEAQQDDATGAAEALPDFTSITDTREKKQAFFDYLRPKIAAENQKILKDREFLLALNIAKLSQKQTERALRLAKRYDVTVTDKQLNQAWLSEMLKRVNVLPESLVMTQAANESAWGTSRFAREANNLFGQWCYTRGCGVVPLQRSEGAFHEVAKFSSAQESIHRYFMNVNRNRAYAELRNIRQNLADKQQDLLSVETATALTHGLLAYSERGMDYVQDLQAMIRHNSEFWSQ